MLARCTACSRTFVAPPPLRCRQPSKTDRAQCAERLYGVKNGEEAQDIDDEDEVEDIEAALKKEMSGMKDKKKEKLISAVKMDADCGMGPSINLLTQVLMICSDLLPREGTSQSRRDGRRPLQERPTDWFPKNEISLASYAHHLDRKGYTRIH